LRKGTVIGLANHSVLIARDGTERPIDDSAAPIHNEAGDIAGVVLVFRDCTERRRHEREAQEALCYAEEIVATLREPFLVLDGSLRVKTANASFYRAFQTSEDKTAGRFIYDLGDGQWDIPVLRTLLEEAIPKAIPVHDFEVAHDFPAIGPRNMLLNARRFPPEGGHSSLVLLAIEDVTERKRMDATLQDSELRFRRLFQTAKDGILILDAAQGTIIEANPFICGLLGFEPGDFLGKELWEIGLFQDKDANQDAYRELREKGYIRYEHLPLRTRGGDEVEVEFVSNLYMVGDRQVAQCNIRDITQRSRMERQAKAQAAALADLHRRKDEFLAMISHELRNPLSPILNAVHLLRLQGDESLIQQEARRIIERQVGQLSHLVDDLLEVARFTSGKIRLHLMRLDLRGVVERGVDSARPLIDARKHKLTVSVPAAPIWLDADPTRLEQVVVNLLNNAAKYTDEGGRIWLEARAEGHEAVLTVRDTGIGIDLERFPDIFDLFTQADRSLDRSQGGLGIGLSLVQRIVDMHWGTVEVRSDGLGRGSEFTVRLPLKAGAAKEPPVTLAVSADRPAHVGHVLVVDDYLDSAEILAKLLRLSGHEVRTAHTGPDAIDAATASRPDVVLLDIGLPGLNGYEVARRLRQDARLKGIWLVAMTGYGNDADRQLALEAGFDRYVVKPVDFRNVKELITTLLTSPPAVR
jgi:PAS domain S-box-containing protein